VLGEVDDSHSPSAQQALDAMTRELVPRLRHHVVKLRWNVTSARAMLVEGALWAGS
jgi:hypothetical protein